MEGVSSVSTLHSCSFNAELLFLIFLFVLETLRERTERLVRTGTHSWMCHNIKCNNKWTKTYCFFKAIGKSLWCIRKNKSLHVVTTWENNQPLDVF